MSGLDLGTAFGVFLPRGQANGQATQMVLEAPAAIAIPPMTAVRFVGAQLYPVDVMQVSHANTACGFSVAGADLGSTCKYTPRGEIAKASSLTAGQVLFQNVGGGVTTTPAPVGAVFSLRVGQVVSSSQLGIELSSFTL